MDQISSILTYKKRFWHCRNLFLYLCSILCI